MTPDEKKRSWTIIIMLFVLFNKKYSILNNDFAEKNSHLIKRIYPIILSLIIQIIQNNYLLNTFLK
jgi:hypothetical protein